MKKTLLRLLIVLIPFLCSSQTEYVLLGGTQVDIQNAINNLNNSNNGFGTITIKGNVSIQQNIIIPSGITLNFYTGNKLIVNTGVKLDIRGNIKTSTTQVIETNELSHNIKIYNQPVYPEWFGECSYQNSFGINQDEVPIQKAINSLVDGGEILFKGNEYVISSTLEVSVPSITLSGKGTYSAGNQKTNEITVANENVQVIFNINTYGTIISNLTFKGKTRTVKGANAKGKALSFTRADGSKDLDSKIYNCIFSYFRVCVYGEGANLRIVDNTFTESYIGISIHEAQKEESNHNEQTRGHIIDRNRFHSMGSSLNDQSLVGSTCIIIKHKKGVTYSNSFDQGYTIRGYYNQITNNYADDCKTFFEGVVDRTKIDGNSILSSGGTAIKAFGGFMGTISNNIIDGSFTWNPNKLYPAKSTDASGLTEFPSGHGIHVNFAHFMTIHNNQILNKRYHGIFIERSKNSSIQSNIIMNFNRHRYIKRGCKNNDPNSGGGENESLFCGEPIEDDNRIYDGIHIFKVQDDNPSTNDKYNVQNIVSNNTITIPHQRVEGQYGIYAGDGDDYNFIKNNFIVSARMIQTLKIE